MTEVTVVTEDIELTLVDVAEIGPPGASFNARGEWDVETEYLNYDLVTFEGSSYFLTANSLTGGDSPDQNTDDWALLAEKGENAPTDHGALTGLADDDHTQYHNDARGDVRYYTKSQSNSNFVPQSYLDTDATLSANSDTKVATQKAVKSYADQLIAAANATVYKGVVDCSTNPNYPAADAGWLYRASVGGKIGGSSGTIVEAGDMFICLTDGTVAGNEATVGANWNVVQANIDGAVIASSSSYVDNSIPRMDGITGKLIQGSGVLIDDSNNVSGIANVTVATETVIPQLTSVTGTQAAFTPTSNVVIHTGASGTTFHGLVSSATIRRVTFIAGTQQLFFRNESGTSTTPANRFKLPNQQNSALVVNAGYAVTFYYNTDVSRWQVEMGSTDYPANTNISTLSYNTGNPVVDIANYKLKGNSNVDSIDFNNRRWYNNSGVKTGDYHAETLFHNSVASLAWGTREWKNSIGLTTGDYESGYLIDPPYGTKIQWVTGDSYVSFGGGIKMNGNDLLMNDGSGFGGGDIYMDGGDIMNGGAINSSGLLSDSSQNYFLSTAYFGGLTLHMGDSMDSGGGEINMGGGDITNATTITALELNSAGLISDSGQNYFLSTAYLGGQNLHMGDSSDNGGGYIRMGGGNIYMNDDTGYGGGTLNMEGGDIVTASGDINMGGGGDIYDVNTLGVGTASPSGKFHVKGATSTDIQTIIQGAASQSASLTEWQNSSNTVVAKVASNGVGSFSTGLTNTEIIGNGAFVTPGSAAGAGCTVVGAGSSIVSASYGAHNSTVIGAGTTAGHRATAIGYGLTVPDFSVALGREITYSGSGGGTLVGYSHTTSTGTNQIFGGNNTGNGYDNALFGTSLTASGSRINMIGASYTISQDYVTAFGFGNAASQAPILRAIGTSDTTARPTLDITSSWATATDASRKARVVFNVYDTAAREAMRIEASGSAPMIGFLGASAVVRQATTGTATGFTAGSGTAVKDDSTFTGGSGSTAYRISDIVLALKNLGLLTV